MLKLLIENRHSLSSTHASVYASLIKISRSYFSQSNGDIIKYKLHTEKYSGKPLTEIIFEKEKEMCIRNNTNNTVDNCFNYCKKMFLPRDYPRSVREGYLHYTNYSFLIATLINWMDFLSTQSLINSLGVSKQTSMKLSPGLNWVIKDGIGQFVSIFFATKYSRSFERNLKQWRILTLLIYNSALYLEIICMKIQNPFTILTLASLAQSLKVCATFGNVSARVGILSHFSKNNNISDLQNKSNAQGNASFVLGTLLGMGASFLIPQTQQKVIGSISLASLLYVLFAYKSIEKVILPQLNFSRGVILLKQYFDTGKIMSLEEVNKKEGVFVKRIPNMHFASCGLDHICAKVNNDQDYLTQILNLYKENNFICYVEPRKKFGFDIYTVIEKNADSNDVLMALLYTVKMHSDLTKMGLGMTKEKVIRVAQENIDFVKRFDKLEFVKQLKEMGYSKTNLLETNFLRYERIEAKHCFTYGDKEYNMI